MQEASSCRATGRAARPRAARAFMLNSLASDLPFRGSGMSPASLWLLQAPYLRRLRVRPRVGLSAAARRGPLC